MNQSLKQHFCWLVFVLFSSSICFAQSTNECQSIEGIVQEYYETPGVQGAYTKLCDKIARNVWYIIGENHYSNTEANEILYAGIEDLASRGSCLFVLYEGLPFTPGNTDSNPIGLEFDFHLYFLCVYQLLNSECCMSNTNRTDILERLRNRHCIGKLKNLIKEHWDLQFDQIVKRIGSDKLEQNVDVLKNTTESVAFVESLRMFVRDFYLGIHSPLSESLKKRLALYSENSLEPDCFMRHQLRDDAFLKTVAMVSNNKTDSIFVIHVGELHRRHLANSLHENGKEIETYIPSYYAINLLGFDIELNSPADACAEIDNKKWLKKCYKELVAIERKFSTR